MQENDYGVKHMASRRILKAKHKRLFPNKNQRGGLTRVILKAGSKKRPCHATFHLINESRLTGKSMITERNKQKGRTIRTLLIINGPSYLSFTDSIKASVTVLVIALNQVFPARQVVDFTTCEFSKITTFGLFRQSRKQSSFLRLTHHFTSTEGEEQT